VSADQISARVNAKRTPQGQSRANTGDGGAGLVFWWLIAMAVAGFAPCMILPAWREYQAAELTERVRTAEVGAASAKLHHLRRRLDAVHNDPAVVTRLARRELEFRRSGETFVAAGAGESPRRIGPATPEAEIGEMKPAAPPVPVARLVALAPQLDYDRLFCDSPTRQTILVLSAGLFVAAFVVFWPRAGARDHLADGRHAYDDEVGAGAGGPQH